MPGAQVLRAFEKKIADPPRRFVTTFRIVTPDDFIQSRDQRCRESHPTYSNPPRLAGFWAI
jgi:type IV secretory pathway TrbF-like protein